MLHLQYEVQLSTYLYVINNTQIFLSKSSAGSVYAKKRVDLYSGVLKIRIDLSRVDVCVQLPMALTVMLQGGQLR